MTLTVSTWATLTASSLGRTDGITEVGEKSEGDVVFGVNLPVDANCRLKIVFPSDQPLTSDLTLVSGVGVIDTSGYTAPSSINIASNYIYVDGCPSY